MRLVNNAEDFLKYTSKPAYIAYKLFGKNYAAIDEIKPVLIRDKVGFTVLDLSKWKMYDFHDNFIKKNFDAELLFTDTDNFANEIKSENVCGQFFKWKDLFDFSNYAKECNTAKEVSIATEFEKFKDVLLNKKIIRHKMKGIQSKKHKLGTYEIDKISLSCFDDKRYVLNNGIYTLAYFHKDSVRSCKKIQKDCDKNIVIKKIVITEKDCNKEDCDN